MEILVPNVSWALRLCLTTLRVWGYWWPRAVEGNTKILWSVFTFLSLTYTVGTYIIVQAAELVCVLGDVSRMTSALFMLFTNMALCFKMINVIWRRDQVYALVDEMDKKLRDVKGNDGIAIVRSIDKQATWELYVYTFISLNVVFGLSASGQKPNLPLPARYPFDISKSPAYDLIYAHQASALLVSALVNISFDTLVTILIAQCYCRFKLLALSLKNLCQDLKVDGKKMLSEEDEKTAMSRLLSCAHEHQAVLQKAAQIQENFSMHIFCQLTVSSFIICVTAYQLAFEEMKFVRLWSLLTYLTVMMMQVFKYCYHGNELSLQSTEIAAAAYDCPWYVCSARLRRVLLMMMTRSVRVVYITAGGITILSIGTFMRIIKGSYSFFTMLQSVQE